MNKVSVIKFSENRQLGGKYVNIQFDNPKCNNLKSEFIPPDDEEYVFSEDSEEYKTIQKKIKSYFNVQSIS